MNCDAGCSPSPTILFFQSAILAPSQNAPPVVEVVLLVQLFAIVRDQVHQVSESRRLIVRLGVAFTAVYDKIHRFANVPTHDSVLALHNMVAFPRCFPAGNAAVSVPFPHKVSNLHTDRKSVV